MPKNNLKHYGEYMKKFALILLTTLVSCFAFAEPQLECANTAVEAATVKNFRTHGANTQSCGAKLLTAGESLETYLVCVSDETDPSEWVVVIQKAVFKKNKLVQTCGVLTAEAQYDSQTPNFEDDQVLLETVKCEMADDDKKATCK
jgi:hypothetical protein